jgi:hypothetical protein
VHFEFQALLSLFFNPEALSFHWLSIHSVISARGQECGLQTTIVFAFLPIYSFVSVNVRSFSLIVFGIVKNFALFPCPEILFDMNKVRMTSLTPIRRKTFSRGAASIVPFSLW